MNKTELIDFIASSAEISKVAAGRALEAVLEGIISALSKGDMVSLVNFGTFSVRKREARNGRNPKTGETIKIEASKIPGFKAGTGFKKAIQKQK
jgi:DNA-binding protein HU-beta